MTLLGIHLKRVTTFLYFLAFLFIFNLYFNLNYEWYGISLVVRLYIYVFSFYLIFNFAGINIRRYENRYFSRFGSQGEQVLFFEARIAPFLIIYAIAIMFSLIESVRQPNWPWAPVIGIANGKFTDLLIFSLFLLFVLKLKKDPYVTIPIFFALCLLYFLMDMLYNSIRANGIALQFMMYFRFIIFFFFLFAEFYLGRSPIKMFITSLWVSLIVFMIFFGSFVLIYFNSGLMSYQKREAGLHLLRLGYSFPLPKLQRILLEDPDAQFLKTLLAYSEDNGLRLKYDSTQWERLLFSGSVEMADAVSRYGREAKLAPAYEKVIAFAENASSQPDSRLQNAPNFIRLCARSLRGNERDFQDRVARSNARFTGWGISVMGESRDASFIPFLVVYLTDIDPDLAQTAYAALVRITGQDPKEKLNRRINDPEVIVVFRDYYARSRTAP
jgi:hypothetical protein